MVQTAGWVLLKSVGNFPDGSFLKEMSSDVIVKASAWQCDIHGFMMLRIDRLLYLSFVCIAFRSVKSSVTS